MFYMGSPKIAGLCFMCSLISMAAFIGSMLFFRDVNHSYPTKEASTFVAQKPPQGNLPPLLGSPNTTNDLGTVCRNLGGRGKGSTGSGEGSGSVGWRILGLLGVKYTGWWFQPIWKILVKMGVYPQVEVKIKSLWNHHLVYIWVVIQRVRRSPSSCQSQLIQKK